MLDLHSFQIPRSLEICFSHGLLIGVIQFGSSLYSENASDIDLAVIVKEKMRASVIELIDPETFINFDISLIFEEEIYPFQQFRFGSHGVHIIESFRQAKTLLGINPFLAAPVITREDLCKSVNDRLADYIYLLRKSYFVPAMTPQVLSRYNKIVKLSLFLLSDSYNFPNVLELEIRDAITALRSLGVELSDDKLQNLETLWKKIRSNNQY